ncbi:MAG: tetratricopeptide repeat protein [Chitinophagaceae bacterium]|nr:tetratricopeptide repeat protein [Chitinophagaceae bacterium]
MLTKRLLYIFFYLLGTIQVSAIDYHDLLHKSYADRRSQLFTFYTDELNNPDRNLNKSQQKVIAIKALAQQEKDRDLLLETVLMQIHVDDAFKQRTKKESLRSIDSLLQIAEDEKIPWLKCRCLSFAALLCFIDAYNYELAFNYAELLNLSLQTITKEEFPEKQICYSQIAHYYYYFHDWLNALRYCELGLNETPKQWKDQYPMQMCNIIGLVYEKQKDYKKAIAYYKKAIQYIIPNDPTLNIWVGILNGNIGNCQYLLNNPQEAIPHLQSCIDSALKYQSLGVVSDAFMTLGKIDLDQNKLENAERNLRNSRIYAMAPVEYPRLENLYVVLARLAQKKGNALLTSLYLDSAMTVKDSMSRKLNALFILRGRQKAAVLKEQKLEADKQLKTTQRNFLIALIFLATFSSMYIFYIQRKRFQQKRAIDRLQLQQHEQELHLASEKLNAFANTISEKNRLLNDLEMKLGDSPKLEVLAQLKESTILTEEEWDRFRKLFELVHKGYMLRLKEKLPDLTQAETRFMVLAKLKFSNKEMAGALNISTQAIRTTWYRLRKKLNLPEEGSLEELVDTI